LSIQDKNLPENFSAEIDFFVIHTWYSFFCVKKTLGQLAQRYFDDSSTDSALSDAALLFCG
jgi:hypothetical protein